MAKRAATKTAPDAIAAAKTAGTKKIPEDVLAVLRDLVWTGNTAKIVTQLKPAVYAKVKPVLAAAGGRWDRKSQTHIFDNEDAEFLLREAALVGHYLDAKKAFQFFETPMFVSAQVANLAVSKFLVGRDAVVDPIGREKINNARMLEPSAGNGNLINSARNAGVHAKNTRAYDINQKCIDTLIRRFPGMLVALQDFLQVPIPEEDNCYDIILMNPPFTQLGDVRHVSHALDFLKTGGVLVAIMSPAWTYRDAKQVTAFKDKLAGFKHVWELLPEGSFEESGTGVRTGVLCVERI